MQSPFLKKVIAHNEADDFTVDDLEDRRACLELLRHSKQKHVDVVTLASPFLKEFVIEPSLATLNPHVGLYAFWHDEELRVAWSSTTELSA